MSALRVLILGTLAALALYGSWRQSRTDLPSERRYWFRVALGSAWCCTCFAAGILVGS